MIFCTRNRDTKMMVMQFVVFLLANDKLVTGGNTINRADSQPQLLQSLCHLCVVADKPVLEQH